MSMKSPLRTAGRGRFTAAAVGPAAGTADDHPGTAVFADTLSFAFAIAVALWPGDAGVMGQTGRTLTACGPFCPWVVSNSTFWFSSSDL